VLPPSPFRQWPAAGTIADSDDPDAAVTTERAWLSLSTGRVVAADPVTAAYLPLPFAQTVPPGRYPVDLLVEYGYVAAARLVATG
jgi:hypothetical protein